MSKKTIQFIVGAVLVSTMLAFAGEEHRAQIEAEEQALLLKAQAFELHIQDLRAQSLEHEAQAKALQAEALRVEIEMRREIETHKIHIEMAAAEVEVQQILAEARHLGEEGHHEEAHELEAQAERQAAALNQRRRVMEEHELDQERQRSGHLREKAEAAKREGRPDEAHHLWTEAEAVEKRLAHALERREKRTHIEEMERKVHHMFQEAEELERQGRRDKAHALRAQAEELAQEVHAHMRNAEGSALEQAEREIMELRAQSERAEKEGRIEEAKQLWKQAAHMEEELKAHMHEHERHAPLPHMHERLQELQEAIEIAARQGREREVEELREEARELEREMHGHEREMEVHELEQKMEHLHHAAEEAQERGQGEKAQGLRHEAERIESKLREMNGEHGHHEGGEETEGLRREIETLHKQIGELHEVVEHLKRERR